MKPLLSTEGLRFKDLINYPQIQIKENQFTFITGESGCGKSTLLKLINKTVLPSSGTILYNSCDIMDMDTIKYRRHVLLVPQEVFLFNETIKANFDLYYAARDEKPLEENAIKIFLHTCCADFPPETNCTILSGGQRQRVFLAICLSFLPDVLLLDEPISALDEKTAELLLTNIKAFCAQHKITPIAVCHSKHFVQQFSDYSIELKKEGIK